MILNKFTTITTCNNFVKIFYEIKLLTKTLQKQEFSHIILLYLQ